MDKEHLLEDLRDCVARIRAWDREDINRMYGWLVEATGIRRALADDGLFFSLVRPQEFPVGSSPAPDDRTNVWTWDNHGRYLVGEEWTEEKLKIRRLDELSVK